MDEEITTIAVIGEDNSMSSEKNRLIFNDLLKITLNRKYNLKIYNYNAYDYINHDTDINVHFGVINPVLLNNTKLNIFI